MVEDILEKYKEIEGFRKKAGLPPFDGTKNSGAISMIQIGKKNSLVLILVFRKPQRLNDYIGKSYLMNI